MRVAAKHLQEGMVIVGLPPAVFQPDYDYLSGYLPESGRVVVGEVQERSTRRRTHVWIDTRSTTERFSWQAWEAANEALFDVEVAA